MAGQHCDKEILNVTVCDRARDGNWLGSRGCHSLAARLRLISDREKLALVQVQVRASFPQRVLSPSRSLLGHIATRGVI